MLELKGARISGGIPGLSSAPRSSNRISTGVDGALPQEGKPELKSVDELPWLSQRAQLYPKFLHGSGISASQPWQESPSLQPPRAWQGQKAPPEPGFPLCIPKPWPSSAELQQQPGRALPLAGREGEISVSIRKAGRQKQETKKLDK